RPWLSPGKAPTGRVGALAWGRTALARGGRRVRRRFDVPGQSGRGQPALLRPGYVRQLVIGLMLLDAGVVERGLARLDVHVLEDDVGEVDQAVVAELPEGAEDVVEVGVDV